MSTSPFDVQQGGPIPLLIKACGRAGNRDTLQDVESCGDRVMQDERPDIVRQQPQEPEIRACMFEEAGAIPNNPRLPALHVRAVVDADAGPAAIRRLLEANGWGGTWQYTVFDFHHYHPNAHEVLVVASGWADLILGGPGGPTVRVESGDLIALPAGTGHCRARSSSGFQVCGAYPPGQEGCETLRHDGPRPGDVLERISGVPLPATDPVYRPVGPLLERWAGGD